MSVMPAMAAIDRRWFHRASAKASSTAERWRSVNDCTRPRSWL